MKQKLFDLKCAECGKVFRSPNEEEKFCPDCKKIKEKKKRKPKSDKSLWAVLRELEKYNKEHGTKLSYGEYVSLVDKQK